MKRYQFEELTTSKKHDFLQSSGSFVGERSYYNQKYILYSVDDYFAEVRFCINSEDKINLIQTLGADDPIINTYINLKTSKS